MRLRLNHSNFIWSILNHLVFFLKQMSQDCSFEQLGYTFLTCWDPVTKKLHHAQPRTGSICELPHRADNISEMVECTSIGWSKIKEKQYCMHILSLYSCLYKTPLFCHS